MHDFFATNAAQMPKFVLQSSQEGVARFALNLQSSLTAPFAHSLLLQITKSNDRRAAADTAALVHDVAKGCRPCSRFAQAARAGEQGL